MIDPQNVQEVIDGLERRAAHCREMADESKGVTFALMCQSHADAYDVAAAQVRALLPPPPPPTPAEALRASLERNAREWAALPEWLRK